MKMQNYVIFTKPTYSEKKDKPLQFQFRQGDSVSLLSESISSRS